MIVGVVGPRESCVIIRKAIQQIDQSHEVRLYTRELVREAVDVIDTCEQECDGVIIYRKRYLRVCAGASPDAETLHIHQTVRQQYCGSISENGQGRAGNRHLQY